METELNSLRLNGLLVACFFACVLVGCQKPNEALVHQMEELKKELAELKSADKKPSPTVKTSSPEQRSNRAISRPPQARSTQTPRALPVVRMRPEPSSAPNTRWSPSAPVARALQPKKQTAKAGKEKKQQDIALPTPEVPPLVFQTLDEYGQVHGAAGVRSNAAPAPAQSEPWMLEDDEREPEVQMMGSAGPLDAPDLIPVAVAPPKQQQNPFPPSPPPADLRMEENPQNALGPESHPMTLVASSHVAREETSLSAAEHLYKVGMTELKRKAFGPAIVSFEELVRDYPEDGLADNALYWIAESRYAQGKFSEALKGFQRVLRAYPLGNKVPDAMVKVGLCFQNLGKKAQARQILEQVMAIYPESPAAQVAASRLPTM